MKAPSAITARRALRAAACLALAWAAARGEQLSGYPGAFAPQTAGARGLGLAGAQAAGPTGVEALSENPAAVADVRDWAGGYQYGDLFGLLPRHYTAGLWRPGGRPYALGAAWIEDGDKVYSENELILGGAWAKGWLALGANYKFRFAGTGDGGSDFRDPETNLNHRVEGSALGWLGFDLGLRAMPFGPKYTFGVVAKDLLSRISWHSSNEAGTAAGDYVQYVPATVRAGFRFRPDPLLDLDVDVEPGLGGAPDKLATGLEAKPLELLPESPLKRRLHDLLALRLGYGRNLKGEDPNHALGFGAGLECPFPGLRLGVDFGYQINFGFTSANSLRAGFTVAR